VTVTQDVEDFLNDEHGRTVLKMASATLLLRQDGAALEAVTEAFGLTADEGQFLRQAGKGAGLLFALGAHVALQVEASPEEYRLVTTSPQDLVAEQAAAREAATTNGQEPAAEKRPGPTTGASGAHGRDRRRAERDALRARLRPGRGGRP
jgi:hypothetical protein